MILNALKDRIASPSDVISITGLPRYEVLASFHILEALNIVEVVYIRGNYKIYRLSDAGRKLLEILLNNKDIVFTVESSEKVQDANSVNHVTTNSVVEASTVAT